MEYNEAEWNGTEWNEMERSGMGERFHSIVWKENGMEWNEL